MKNKFLLLMVLFLSCFSCKQEEQNAITGKVDGLEIGDRIILSIEDPDGSKWIAVDSAVVDKVGEFTLKTKVSDNYVQLTYLKSDEKFKPEKKQSPRCFLESYAEISVTGNTADWRYIKMTGGLYNHPDMSEINRITDSANNIQKEGIKQLAESRETNDTVLQKTAVDLIKKSNGIFEDIHSLEHIFIKNHPDMAYSASLLRYDYDLMDNFDEYEKAFSTLSERVQNSPAGILIKNYIENVRASEAGAAAPDFTLKALDGREITLSKFKGKYVLIDFWGSWCRPCRQSSPALVELYNNLKQNNATIEFIGISCNEQNDENWIKAIEDDKLAWIHVNDSHSEKGKSIQKQYAIIGVPTSILISPEGKILYKEHPLDLIPKIKEMFGI
ncbi:MAG: AhpC/TSA family protein [Prevotellaceae bacterium]|nr:AhpC/TSA family protein [Prevotellaceae bacterium]